MLTLKRQFTEFQLTFQLTLFQFTAFQLTADQSMVCRRSWLAQ
ncbi:MAG: hypothetical protein R2856_25510 [Caldilineaceae bacterium]